MTVQQMVMPFAVLRLSEVERGYLAGIVDGEGTINFGLQQGRAHRKGSWYLQVSSTEPALVEWLASRLGGKVSTFPSPTKPRNWKPLYRWQVNGKQAVVICHEIGPLLVIKKAQAQLLVESYQLRRTSRGVDDVADRAREEMHDRFRELNRRGLRRG